MRAKLMTALLFGVGCSLAQATPVNARLYKQQYGYMPSCNACHKDGGGSSLNAYGNAFKDAGKNAAALEKIAATDSDGDGAANVAEAQAKSNPGDKTSMPGKAGNWLDLAALIPREVQAAFPGVKTWQPRDAILTAADIASAKGMGATLTAADENTIYIPVENQYPVGTALIFPASYRGKSFYLLMTTDKQLKITKVEVMHANDVPEAKKSAIYASFIGVPAQSVPAAGAGGSGGSIDASITQAVKNAGVLLYVRLKGA